MKELAPYADIVVSTRQRGVIADGQFRLGSLEEALRQPYVVPCMPAAPLDTFLRAHGSKIRPGSLVIDVCSVKLKPVKALKRYLPAGVQILATHPLFGPASASGGLKNHKLMFYPVRISDIRLNRIKNFLRAALGLRLIECAPQQHDQAMAYVLGLSHYIGRTAQIMGLPASPLATKAYEDLLDMKNVQGNDSLELFRSIVLDNPYGTQTLRQFKRAQRQLDKQLKL